MTIPAAATLLAASAFTWEAPTSTASSTAMALATVALTVLNTTAEPDVRGD